MRASYRILMLAPTMFFADYGCHVRILEEAVALRQAGHSLVILAYPNGRDIADLDVRRCWGVPFNYRVVVGSSRHKFYLDVMLAGKTFLTLLGGRPDVIHAHLHEGALIGSLLGRLWGVPVLFDLQGSLTGEMIDHHFLRHDSIFYPPMRWLEERIDHMPSAIITSSSHTAELLMREVGCAADHIYPVPDCVNTDAFRPDVVSEAERRDMKARLGIPPDRQVVVYLGVLAEYQGTSLLLRAAAEIVKSRPAVHFLIMGYPGVEHYRRLAAELGIADYVTFTGCIPYEKAPLYLALGDGAVAPKISATEGSGKILNYMAMALPTAAFDTPVSREYLGEDGIYAEKGNYVALAEALEWLLREDMPRKDLGQRLRQRVIAGYSWQQAGRRIVEIYDRIVVNK
jgi:glycosyltransferase involved in cell wall biosynthesis